MLRTCNALRIASPPMLRTCNALRIASPPMLRNDELLTRVRFRVHFPATNVQTHVPIPSVEGCRPQAAGWSQPRPNLPKPPSLEGGSVRRRGGCPPQVATNVQTNVSDI
ncbi:MAG: hypothetical protein LBM98_06570 [Oscillospiraceae bacterium]|nr:hypothetical protein [Oscillospiraceae bacterium]